MNSFIKKFESILELGGIKKDIAFLIISGIALLNSIFHIIPLPFQSSWIAIILCGLPIILEALIGLVTAFDIKADVLVSIALIASIYIGQDFAAGEVAFIMQLGGLLEELTVAKARAGIEKLVHLTPQTARVLQMNKEVIVPAKQVRIGDVIRVLPGETVPVDGTLISGQTSINQAVLTGESLPVDKKVGDEVFSGTVNQFGAFKMKATKIGEDSSIQRMIDLVQSTDAGKAKIVGIANRWATWIVIIALTAAILTGLISGEILRAVTILVVFCPCALVLATPTAIMAAIGNATKHGFLVREGDALERLASISKITFDKTGTLTYGTPEVKAVKSMNNNYTEETLYNICASAEKMSEHPLGKAIVNCYQKEKHAPFKEVQNFKMIPGRGVSCNIDNDEIFAGNEQLLTQHHISLTNEVKKEISHYLEQGCTVVYIAINQKAAGYIVLSDTVREKSTSVIKNLHTLGAQSILLTGDNENAASTIAHQLGINAVCANCLPETKLEWIDHFQKNQEKVCMVGDGVNDAPSLKKADVGIAMGGVGSDIAIDAADIALIDDEVKELPHLISLSKRMMITIKCNMGFSMGLNFLAIILAITGILNPVAGALVHNMGSVLVIISSALLLKYNYKVE